MSDSLLFREHHPARNSGSNRRTIRAAIRGRAMRAMFLKLRRRLGASEEKIRNFARLVALALRRSSGVTESPTPARSGNQPVLGEYYKGGVVAIAASLRLGLLCMSFRPTDARCDDAAMRRTKNSRANGDSLFLTNPRYISKRNN